MEKIIGGHISGDYRPGSQSHYSNQLNITDCSLRELDGVTVSCGSQNNPKQAFFVLKVCGELISRKAGTIYVLMSFFFITITDLPLVMKDSVIQVMEGTENCPITVMSTNLTVNNIRWEKNGRSVLQGVDRFTINFNNVARDDDGNYSVTSTIVCHDDKTKEITGKFTLDVVCK